MMECTGQKSAYLVTFKWYETDTYCTNIAIAPDKDAVAGRYEKYPWYCVTETDSDTTEMYMRRGMPIIEI